MSSNPPPPYPCTFSPSIRALLDRLHDESSTQESQIDPAVRKQIRAAFEAHPEEGIRLEDDQMRDKFIALDKDKALFVHNLILASGATSIVEIGTSFGVSTIYLALAAAASAQSREGVKPKVIATEKEETKAEVAKKHWSEAGRAVEDVIELRVGNLLETLQENVEEVHFVLLDSKPQHDMELSRSLLIEDSLGICSAAGAPTAAAENERRRRRGNRQHDQIRAGLLRPAQGAERGRAVPECNVAVRWRFRVQRVQAATGISGSRHCRHSSLDAQEAGQVL